MYQFSIAACISLQPLLTFAGRRIYIAPDNDEAGIGYQNKLTKLLRDAGAEVVAVINVDLFAKEGTKLAKGYDLADAEVDGWTTEKLAALGETLWISVPSAEPAQPTRPNERGASEVSTGDTETITHSKKKKTHQDYASDFASVHGGHVAAVSNQVLAYSNGYWAPLNPDVEIKRPLLSAIGPDATAAKVNSVFELLKIQYAERPEKFERRSPLICVNNGTLDPTSGTLHSHDPAHGLMNKLDIAYDPSAKCPLWIQTLEEIFAPDPDKTEKIQLIQEFVGYCLVPDTRHHKFIWLVGSGGNGKSLILSVVTALVGHANISNAQIERLEAPYVRAELQGKLVNISSEMSADATLSDSFLKQIVAGETIEAERKYERPFSFKVYARMIGATNTLPRLLDHSDGFTRRAMIVRFNRKFTEEERDVDRESKLLAELPGILNWAVEGLRNLNARTRFVIPQSSNDELAQYQQNSDPVRMFADDFLTATNEKAQWVPSAKLYGHYKDWSGENGYRTLANNQFSERLSAVGIKKERDSRGRYWAARYWDKTLEQTLPRATNVSPISHRYSM